MTKRPYLEGTANRDITDGLKSVLADTFLLYFKTHSFHWNIVGPNFLELHELFEKQYTELWQATDEIAERIRALDVFAPTSFNSLLVHATLEESGQTPDREGMVSALAEDNRAIVDQVFPVIRAAEEAGDDGTMDLLVARTRVHEKAAWMLESLTKH